MRKRLEILIGQRLMDTTSARMAVEVQDKLRQKSKTLRKGKSSVEILREWREGRWSS
ncbi:MAG: hypothetical protein HY929_08745 [Euryarchaeota archaeon]|nr:hypothetical protein [Euryarchaeota archaeon]